ncbi:MAG TPA: NAD(P)-dependent alcohol dehydrogenase [Aggregatilinea sp.]|uniref:NAD(P)-dependent alcohol dehydrogenase n=1 Tax=Aggregatilinea sp. TaxID=2806333 RepID=UPI002C9BEEFB|nr:NAD(P)-dependent alcohol dehydrogenase [Aggregatilinea sp.]HML20995.1 NAD(P)-dependent alcohol dehydrogenase [Aggregatilinea sp.]
MKAVVCTKYGPPEVLQLKEVEKPTPKHHEVCIKIRATAVTASDCIVRGFKLPIWHPIGLLMGLVVGFRGPRNSILGMVLAGEIEAVGRDVTQFKSGDQVFAFTGTHFGCYAEYTCLPEGRMMVFPGTVPSVITAKPSTMTYEEAAAVVYGVAMASHFLRGGHIQRGQKVLIYGASGAIGTTAVQIAKHHYGAEVTGVCSTANLEFVTSLGADHVLDYTRQDSVVEGARYDFVMDAVGKKKSSKLKLACKNALTANGKYMSVDSGNPTPRLEDLVLLRELIEAGKFRAVIDRCYPLEQIVEAHRYVDQGHKKGNVVITVA